MMLQSILQLPFVKFGYFVAKRDPIAAVFDFFSG